jgi:hypothetical protein
MLARPFQGTVPEVLDFIASSTKATKLIGFFHGFNLAEMTTSGVSYRDVFSFSKDRNVMFKGLKYMAKAMTADMDGEAFSKNPVKAIGQLYKSFMTGSGVLANRPLALDMAEAGFKHSSADGEMYGILERYMAKTENYLATKIGENPSKTLMAIPRVSNQILSKGIFDYMRTVGSMLVYENNVADSIKKFNLDVVEEPKKMPIDQIKQAVANQTSKEMGGVQWSQFMVHPKTQQVLQWAFLAPEWKAGRAMMGVSVFQPGPEGRQARKQMLRLFIGWYVTSNMINYAQTKKYLGKGRWMSDNPEGYKAQAFLSKDKDGEKYLTVSKGLTDIYDDVTNPGGVLARSVSPGVKAAASVMNWMGDNSYHAQVAPENPLTSILHAYQPMWSSGNSVYGGIPVHKGPSKNKVEGILDRYYQGGMKNQALFKEAMATGIEEGYDMKKVDQYVRANRTRKQNQEYDKALFH